MSIDKRKFVPSGFVNREHFEEAKKDIIEFISNLTYEDDPHVFFLASHAHSKDQYIRVTHCCEGWLIKELIQTIKDTADSQSGINN